MSSIWKHNLGFSLFGESHGIEEGIVIDNFPAGLNIDLNNLQTFINRRKPQIFGTERKETDTIEILSGLYNGKTSGAPITIVFRNNNASCNNKEYEIARPSHCDYTAWKRYNGYNDIRGGGHLSGRITLPMVAMGGLCIQLLQNYGIEIYSHILSVGKIKDKDFYDIDISMEFLNELRNKNINVLDDEKGQEIIEFLSKCKKNGDSAGGSIQCVAFNVPAGLGSPLIYGIDSIIASLAFAVPALKSIYFGLGNIPECMGSEVYDEFIVENNEIKTKTNFSGGLNGGITNGMPIIFTVGFKPVATIKRHMQGLKLDEGITTDILSQTRNDICIAMRASVIAESVMAIVIADAMNINTL